MSLAGSFITASVNNLDNTSGCKIIFEYAEYVFDTFEYTIHAYTEGSPNPGVSIEKVISPSDVVNNKVEWNLGVVTVVQDPAQRNQASRVAAAMANYAEFPFKLTMQAMVKTTTQNLFDDYEGNLSFKFTEASAPVVNDLYLESISEANSTVSSAFGSGVHVMTKSILSVNRDFDYAPTYKNYATQSKIVYSVGAGTDIITSETTLLSGVKGYGNYVVTATAYDSRGFSSVMRKENVLVQKWEVPHFDAVCSAARNRSSGQSPNLLCTISGMFSPIFRNSSLVNEPHMYVKFGALSGDVITDYAVNQWHTVNFPSGSYGSSGTFTMNQTTLNTAFSSEPTKNPVAFINAYSDRDLYLDFTVYDRSDFPGSFPPQPSQQGDDYIRFHIPEATPVVSLRKKKIGINKNNPTEAVDIHGNAKVDGVLTISNDPNWTPSTTQINKVWKTDSNGTPGWRDENPGGVTSVNNKTGAVTLNASDVGAPTTSDLTTHTGNGDIHVTSNDKTNWNDKIASTEKGAVNGVATLGSNGKIPMSQLDDAITGNVRFQDVWNASTNTPTLPNRPAFADKGKYWITTVAGTFQGVTYNVGDWILASWSGDEESGTGSWRRVPNTDAVSSVDGLTGAVVLNDIKYTTQSLTDAQKLQARTNIGAGTGSSNFSGNYNDLTNKPTLFSGNYNDLTNKPTIPSALSDLSSDANHRLVTDDNKSTWNAMLPKAGGTMSGSISLNGNPIKASSGTQSIIKAYQSGSEQHYQVFGSYTTDQLVNAIVGGSAVSKDVLETSSGGSVVHKDGDNEYEVLDKGNYSDILAANSGTTTANLTKLQVGDTIYKVPSALSDLSSDADHRLVTDTNKSTWNGMLPKAGGTMTGSISLNGNPIKASSGEQSIIKAYQSGSEQHFQVFGSYVTDQLVHAIVGGSAVSKDILETSSGGTVVHKDGDNEYEVLDKGNYSDILAANPGTGTTDLTTLKVGDTVYNIPQGGGTVITEVFLVVYGTTTHANILAAKASGKEVVCMSATGYTDKIFRLIEIDTNKTAIFSAIDNLNKVYSFMVPTTNVYTTVSVSTLMTDRSVINRSTMLETWYADGTQTYGSSWPMFAKWVVVNNVSVLDLFSNNTGTTDASSYDVRAHRAIKDGDGNTISSTYLKGSVAAATYLAKGGDTMTGDLAMSNKNISGVQNLSANTVVAKTLKYTDNLSEPHDVEVEIGNLSTAINAKYTKDANGIPESDLTAAVRAKLNTVAGNDEQRGLVTETLMSSGQMKYITNWIPSTEFLGTISITNSHYHKELYFSFTDSTNTPRLVPYQRTKIADFTLMPLMYVAISIVDSNKYLRIGIRQDTVPTNYIVSMQIPNATDRYLRSSAAVETGGYYTYDESNLVT